jgi:putative transposase
MTEMYVQRVSIPKVSAITEQLCGSGFSASQISRPTELLDEILYAWWERTLGKVVFFQLDIPNEKVH